MIQLILAGHSLPALSSAPGARTVQPSELAAIVMLLLLTFILVAITALLAL